MMIEIEKYLVEEINEDDIPPHQDYDWERRKLMKKYQDKPERYFYIDTQDGSEFPVFQIYRVPEENK